MAETRVQVLLGDLVPAVFKERPNRFIGIVEVNGENHRAHIMDPGRLEELLFPGNTVMVRRVRSSPPNPSQKEQPSRKTNYDLVLASYGDILVCIDTRYPNLLVEKALKLQKLVPFRGYSSVKREITFNHPGQETDKVKSRFDFLLRGEGLPTAFIEVKSVTLAKASTGLFPDAPTKRGARHIRELMLARDLGYSANLVFVAQREDVEAVSPNKTTDPEFAKVLGEAASQGLGLLAYKCCVSQKSISLDPAPIPVLVNT